MSEKKIFTIYGNPVKHSRSPLMHNHVFKSLGFNGAYTRTLLEDGTQLKANFFSQNLQGANVTIPHKEAAFKACDEVRGFALDVGVVNTLVNENGKLIGYNTDADGFLFAIEKFKNINSILIIGAGGIAKALGKKFKLEGFDVSVLNRSEGNLKYFKKNGFETFTWEACPVKSYDMIVNTTSAGLSDENYPAPLELLSSILEKTSYSADAIYGKMTPFLKLCQQMNITYKDGADMLLGQGVLANNYFTKGAFDLERVQEVMKESFEF